MSLTPYTALVASHGSFGLIALSSYWMAGFARKGSPFHRRVGRWFLIAMMGIGITGVPLALLRFWHGNTVGGVFLLYLLVITFNAAWSGWRAVQLKRDFAAYSGPAYKAVAWMTLLSGAAVLVLGLQVHDTVLTGFSFVGLLRGGLMLRLATRAAPPGWALKEHFGSMIGCGVATHIAFLSIGLAGIIPAAYAAPVQRAAWLGPLVLALIAGVYFSRKYARKPLAV